MSSGIIDLSADDRSANDRIIDLSADDRPKKIVDISMDGDDELEDLRGTFTGRKQKAETAKLGGLNPSYHSSRRVKKERGEGGMPSSDDDDFQKRRSHDNKSSGVKKERGEGGMPSSDDDDLQKRRSYDNREPDQSSGVKKEKLESSNDDKSRPKEASEKTKKMRKLSRVRREGQERSDYKEAVKFQIGLNNEYYIDPVTQKLDAYFQYDRNRFIRIEKREKKSAKQYVKDVKEGKRICPHPAYLKQLQATADAKKSEVDKFHIIPLPYDSANSYEDMGFTSDSGL
jgi:hypothetical protein